MLKQWLANHTLTNNAWGGKVVRILEASLSAVDPQKAVHSAVEVQANTLSAGEHKINLEAFERIHLIAFGKAALPMAKAVKQIINRPLSSAIVLTKDGHAEDGHKSQAFSIFEASHPLPDQRGVKATEQILKILAGCNEKDLVIVAISGGGSALLTQPAEGVELRDIQAVTKALLEAGASINEFNSVRKHLDQIKGGGLARAVRPAYVLSLILSDVVGNHLDVIASGPTVADTSTFGDALQVVKKYGIQSRIPNAARDVLEHGSQGDIEETLKPGDAALERVANILVGSNEQAVEAAAKQARVEGFSTQILSTTLEGEARQLGKELALQLKEEVQAGAKRQTPFCLIGGGETTVTITGEGLGGRNQEMALAAVEVLGGLPNVAFVALASDGGDGPTEAAGAIVTGDSLGRAERMGLDPKAFLANNDSYRFFAELEDLLVTGPTQTNVNDLYLLFAF